MNSSTKVMKMSELLKTMDEKKEKIKEMLKRLQKGEDVEKVKKEFVDVLSSISPLEIPIIEQELVKEGISPREIALMCDIHVEVFRNAVSGAEKDILDLPQGHPLRNFYDENLEIMKDAEQLNLYISMLKDGPNLEAIDNLKYLLSEMRKIGFTHYNREEMLLFPYLERRGLSAVPSVLWRKHDEIRYGIRRVLKLFEKEDELWKKLRDNVPAVASAVLDMVFRENNILYPTALALLSEGEWVAIKEEEREIGFYKITPKKDWIPEEKPVYPYEITPTLDGETLLSLPYEVRKAVEGKDINPDTHKIKRDEDLELNTGFLSPEEIDAIFNHLPLDISFIDRDDRVRFFSSGHRIFTRTKSVIGRKVHLCHPPKSVHIVNKILRAFKSGERDLAEFWINMGGRTIYIKYIPVRNRDGEYIGTLEITQDITDLKKIEGEKKLLDWR